MLDLKGKHIVVAGGGLSGIAAANFCSSRGARVSLSDTRHANEITGLPQLDPSIELECGGHTEPLFLCADLIILSPGIPLHVPVINRALQAGIPVWGEIELASRFLNIPVLAITGTNGKSTVTSLCGHILRHCGEQVFIGGNIGTPLIEAVGGAYSVAVVELSSFQLETVTSFHPQVAVLLNISPDHLDRYADMSSYMEAKQRIFSQQDATDVVVLNQDDPQVLALAQGFPARRICFSSSQILAEGLSLESSSVLWRHSAAEYRFDCNALQLRGVHNLENVMAALAACSVRGHTPATMWKAACEFTALPHRMELVRTLNGVRWYNDSKGTNIGSVEKGLRSFDSPLTLIAGGKDKGGDYAILRPLLKEKQPQLILLGAAAEKMAAAWGDICDITMATSMQDAVKYAHQKTHAPGSVLLSPGCSSFDMFSSFTERGEVFTALVQALE
ncbi:MAG: UDP-N-acetylmuramoyl-L-alanine--D-glutamate ligase [Desulfuromonadaceae bacterium]|nr:UDP-N-acetylmuramoyl-L-alanine--D-glutamate ligase [Desulfuromonadaceae bacterium]